jgi:hypothetical protein
MRRGPNAAKFWAEGASRQPDPKAAQAMKKVLAPSMLKLVKDAKKALQDLGSLYKLGSNEKNLAKFATGKEFRDKATKLLASSKAFDQNATAFQQELAKLGGGLYPGSGETDVIVAVKSFNKFSALYNDIRIELGRIR